jgi:nicotinamide-nucleotide amidase
VIVEVIAIGTELLLGQIINSNPAVIGSALAERGFDAHFQQSVGDNLDRMAISIRTAMDRADAVIITGGIGPTQDDITREAVCEATGREMLFSEDYADHLRQWWANRGRSMPESNIRQAYHPAGAELLNNPRGTAPGLALKVEDTWIFCVPGVPAEMEYLLHAELLPRLQAAAGETEVIESRLIRTWGRAESDVAEVLDDLYESTNPSIAFLASASEIKIRITAKADTSDGANALIAPLETEVLARLGESVFGVDEDTIEKILFGLLTERSLTIGTAESMTGGLVAARLTELPGSSAVMRGGLVAYDSELKRQLLGVRDTTEVVNEETAIEMARGAQSLLGVDVAVSVTGSAGPEAMERPAGTVVVGVATPDDARAKELRYPGDRERVRAYSTTSALHLVRLALIDKWWRD